MVFISDVRREWLKITPEEKRDAIAGGIAAVFLMAMVFVVIEIIGG